MLNRLTTLILVPLLRLPPKVRELSPVTAFRPRLSLLPDTLTLPLAMARAWALVLVLRWTDKLLWSTFAIVLLRDREQSPLRVLSVPETNLWRKTLPRAQTEPTTRLSSCPDLVPNRPPVTAKILTPRTQYLQTPSVNTSHCIPPKSVRGKREGPAKPRDLPRNPPNPREKMAAFSGPSTNTRHDKGKQHVN